MSGIDLKFLLFLNLCIFTGFSYSQTTKIVARKACPWEGPCPANSRSGGHLTWEGITIYDWGDHDNNSSTLDTLGWSQCVKATTINSGEISKITQDNCQCKPYFRKTPSNCVGKTSCACTCNRNCSEPWRLNSSTCSCECSLTSCPSSRHTLDFNSCSCNCHQMCSGDFSLDTASCSCVCDKECPDGQHLDESACECRFICTPQSCIKRRSCRVGSGTETASGRKECEGGVLTECRSTGAWDTSQCVVVDPPLPCTRTRPCRVGTGIETGTGTRDSGGNCNITSWDTSRCSACASDTECGNCKKCINRRCVNANTPWTNWSPAWDSTSHCPSVSQKQTRSRCYQGKTKTGTRKLTGTKECECRVDTECGNCKKCINRRCVNKTDTSWKPSWNPLLPANCEKSKEQKRCLNGVLKKQTLQGGPCAQCDASKCTGCKECRNNECVNKRNGEYTNCSGCKKCNNGQCVNKRNGEYTNCSGCKKCSNGRCVKKVRGSQYSGCQGCKECHNGRCVNRTTSWKPPWNRTEYCPSESKEQERCQQGRKRNRTLRGTKCCGESCRPDNKRCPDGTSQAPTGSGFYICKNGRVDRSKCVYTGGWTPSECSDCTPRSASDCPSSHPVYYSGACHKCRGGHYYYIPPPPGRGRGTCCPDNPALGDPCRRIVETHRIGSGRIRNICQSNSSPPKFPDSGG